MSEFSPGDTIKVINAHGTGGLYDNGDVGKLLDLPKFNSCWRVSINDNVVNICEDEMKLVRDRDKKPKVNLRDIYTGDYIDNFTFPAAYK